MSEQRQLYRVTIDRTGHVRRGDDSFLCNVIDVTDKQGRKTRFYISVKTYRVMILSYEDGGIKYKRKFYDYNYAQGTLVPSHSVLWADDKIVEDSEVLNVKFGQKVDEDLFRAG